MQHAFELLSQLKFLDKCVALRFSKCSPGHACTKMLGRLANMAGRTFHLYFENVAHEACTKNWSFPELLVSYLNIPFDLSQVSKIDCFPKTRLAYYFGLTLPFTAWGFICLGSFPASRGPFSFAFAGWRVRTKTPLSFHNLGRHSSNGIPYDMFADCHLGPLCSAHSLSELTQHERIIWGYGR